MVHGGGLGSSMKVLGSRRVGIDSGWGRFKWGLVMGKCGQTGEVVGRTEAQ